MTDLLSVDESTASSKPDPKESPPENDLKKPPTESAPPGAGAKAPSAKPAPKAPRAPRSAKPKASTSSEPTMKPSPPVVVSETNTTEVADKKPRNRKKPTVKKDEKATAAKDKAAGDAKDISPVEEKKAAKKRETRKKNNKTSVSTTSTQQWLSAEGIAMLKELSAKGEAGRKKDALRTGKISMSDLMGEQAALPSDLQRLRLDNLNTESVMQAAFSGMPQAPGFPSLNHRPDKGPYSSAFRPELFKTSIEAYGNSDASLSCDEGPGFGGSVSARRNGRMSPHEILPWVTFAPMYPYADPNQKSGSRPSTSSFVNNGPGTGGFGSPSRSNNFGRPPFQSNPNAGYNRPAAYSGGMGGPRQSVSSTSHMGSGGQGGPTKSRKPFFMPYLSHEAVARGLAGAELIKGSLRVNQRNYEESYIDNPEGDDQTDLLILGIHDRNRALNGDIVVVRIKSREDWVVRDNLYQAWREGHLGVACDDDGKPISIPPIPAAEEPAHATLLNGLVHTGNVAASELDKPVPVCEDSVYDRKTMLLIASRNQKDGVTLNSAFGDDMQTQMENLGISKSSDAVKSSAPTHSSTPQRNSRQQTGNRRNNIKLLNEMPSEDWGMPDVCLQKTAEVVSIAEQRNCRAAMGQLKVMADGNRNWALFSPTDSRMPRMLIPADQLPTLFFERPHDYHRFIFVARMEEWQATAQFARGKLERTLGEAGDIDAETEGLLIENNIDTREFSTSALSSLPITECTAWKIDEKEFKYRRDLRTKTIFTIDPATARDLDDALHCDPCDDIDGKGTPGFEIGVHIADVAHFVLEGTELDHWAGQRATSVYLVHKVIPMLPRILCEELCSLNPGVDRLAFSVIWKMDNAGNIKDEWFGRTVIRSCVKLHYEHAQDMIEHPDKEFPENELPDIHNGLSTVDVKTKVLLLNQMAVQLRDRRIANGSLRLDQPKLKFALDEETKMPCGVTIYERKDSNSLVEEFMLLANESVAKKIESHYPDTSLLRNHPPPKQKVMREILELCQKIGFPLDASTSGMLSSSLRKFEGNQKVQAAINQVLSMFMMKPMQLAKYFCTGTVKSKSDYRHYALSMDYYTHFTSPIRRYADVMVHRLLAASLGYAPAPSASVQDVAKQAEHCNTKKETAKKCSDDSAETFFGLFVKQCGPIVEKAVVVNVLDAAFDVLVLKYGVVKRVYVNRLDMAREPTCEGTPPTLTLFWNPSCGKPNAAIEQEIKVCSVVEVVLSALPEPTKYMAVVKMCPKAEQQTLNDLVLNEED